jgi:hypothetical protein
MASEPNVLAMRPAAPPSETDYLSFCATFSESARGRWFLAEYAKRNRNADTEVLLAALDRIEALVQKPARETGLRAELRVLVDTIRLARPDVEQTANPSMRMAKLTAMLDLLERRIDSMIGTPRADELTAAAPPAALAAPEQSVAEPTDGRTRLSVVPAPDEPELPIPSTASEQSRTIALVTPSATVTVLAPAPAAQVIVLESPVAKPQPSIAETADLTQIVDIAHEADARGFVVQQAVHEPESDPPPPGWLRPLVEEARDQTFVAFEIDAAEIAEPVTPEPADEILGPPERIVVEILKSPEPSPSQPPSVPPAAPAPPAKPQRPAADPLAPLRALSEEEVLALFS